MKKEDDPYYSPATNDHVKRETEYPFRRRHYFSVFIPEEMRTNQVSAEAFIDVLIDFEPSSQKHIITIEEWGVIYDNQWIKPNWVSNDQLQAEKGKVCLK